MQAHGVCTSSPTESTIKLALTICGGVNFSITLGPNGVNRLLICSCSEAPKPRKRGG